MKKRAAWLAAVALLGGVAGITAQQSACGEAATLISAIQGHDSTSTMRGETVTIEGVVTADFQLRGVEMRGFFMQEEAADQDDDPATSEGLFVFDREFGVDVTVGDVVRVHGTVDEFASDSARMTQLEDIEQVTVCSSGQAVAPVALTLPVDTLTDWEQYEGMLVTFSQELTVTEVYNLGRFGEVMLAQGGRLFQPTNIVAPGDPASALQDENLRRQIILDDANLQQNRDPVAYPQGGLSAANPLRAGFTVAGLTGVVDHRSDSYRIQPIAPVTFEDANPRPVSPPDVGGTLRVASMNVLNYFNGDGGGGGFPTERGAASESEFERQRQKTIQAIITLNADVVGLLEMENDGFGVESALRDLVDGLNAATAPGTYAYVQPDYTGTDLITSAIIYRTAAVEPVGAAVALNDAVAFQQARPPVVQTFAEISSGERFTVAVNHFKSKGSCPSAASANGDKGDGQSCWNAGRVESARALTAWLATDPTNSGDPDFLIMGDLNSYMQEDPVVAIEAVGYTNLLEKYTGAESYSYVFYGQFGNLDHVLASAALAGQVTGAAEWHTNADEAPALDYTEAYKTANQVDIFYQPDPFRAADHDPLLVGLQLGTAPATTAEPTEESPAPPTVVPPTETPSDGASGGDDGGLSAILIALLAVVAGIIGLFTRRRGSQSA
jgi:predicted extracellular nuclease